MGEDAVVGVGVNLCQASARCVHPQPPNLFSPPASAAVHRGSWARALETTSIIQAALSALMVISPKELMGRVNRSAGKLRPYERPACQTLLSLRTLSPARERAPCVHVSCYSSLPALLHQRWYQQVCIPRM